MYRYTIQEIAAITGGKLTGSGSDEISFLLTDSRSVFSPSGSVFFAIKGDRHDGHKFIPELIEKGVRNFVVSKMDDDISEHKEISIIQVDDSLKALQKLAAHYRGRFTCPVVGITGSNGKTVLKEWVFQLLEDKKVVRSPKSYNSQVGVPLSVWLLEENTEIALFEAGISKIGEMGNLQKIIRPDIGIFTNIGDAHQENFIDHKHKIKEKLKLFEDAGIIIYCKDYQLIDNQMQQTSQFEDDKLFTWSSKYPANLYITGTGKGDEKTRISAKYKNKEIEITIPFVDNASIENAIHGWCLMLYLGYSPEIISQQFLKLASVAMRLELKQGINNCIIINDSYNSDLGSLSIALDFVKQQQQHNKKTLILSDILQSGKDEHMLYREVSELIRRKEIDMLIGIGTAISRNRELFNMMESSFYNSTDEFLRNIHTHEFHNRAILLKGARQFEFERISNILQQKVHETVLEINLSAITRNLNYYKSIMKPSTKVMVMVKAFSYGSGIFEIASLLQFQRVDYLAVAFADEGVELRKAGITLPILVLNPEVHSYDIMIEHLLEPEIYSHRVLDLFIEAMNRNRISSFHVHVKIDTGMHRLGFVEDDIPELIEKLKTREQLLVRSVFSHLAAAGEKVHDSFTQMQIDRFEKISVLIMKELHYPIMRHILNSSGIECFPDAQFDMVRLGIGLYGVSNTCLDKLANVSTLRTSISQIKKIGPSETIGYSRSGKIGKTSVIATVPVGYADGLNRKLSNGNGKMLVNGNFAPIVGNICMDMCMLDITGIDAEEGDEVIVFGDDYRVNEIAKLLETIPYEIMTGISRRVKRVYYHE